MSEEESKKCTAEEGLKLLNFAELDLLPQEVELFKSEFNKLYDSSHGCFGFIDSVWKVYAHILPFKAYPNEGESTNYIRSNNRDRHFNETVIMSGISDKLKSGKSIDDLISEKKKIFS